MTTLVSDKVHLFTEGRDIPIDKPWVFHSGEVRNVEIQGPTQQLLCTSKYHDFLAIFALAHSKINQIA